MAFAVFLEDVDLQHAAGQIMRPDMPIGEAANVSAVWNGGWREWDTSPLAPAEHNLGSANTCILVLSPQMMTKVDVVAFFRRIMGHFPGDDAALYMDALADHINNTSVEPWPAS